jgi:hypothetical protein
MSSALADLFEADDVDDVEAEVVEKIASENFTQCDVFNDPSVTANWFSVCVLTVPDVDRFPLPARFAAAKQPIDLAGLADLSGGEVRKLILPSLPDEQLDQIEAAEKLREKPRQMVLTAVAAEKQDRGLPCDACGHVSEQFAQWIARVSGNPLSCRIAAVAWLAGDGEIQMHAPVSLEEELTALQRMLEDWVLFDQGFPNKHLSAWDLAETMRFITARNAGLGVLSQPGAKFPVAFCVADGSAWRSFVAEVGGLEVAAYSLGVAVHEIPSVLTPLDVFRMWRESPGSTDLVDAAASRLMLEREMLQIVRTLW